MKVIGYSDLHLGHENILKYEPIRIEKWYASWTWLVRQINENTPPDAIVLNLGDLFFTNNHWSLRWKKKILIKGNHDKYQKLGHLKDDNYIMLDNYYQDKILISHKPKTLTEYSEEIKYRGKFLSEKDNLLFQIHWHSHSNKWMPYCDYIGWKEIYEPVQNIEVKEIWYLIEPYLFYYDYLNKYTKKIIRVVYLDLSIEKINFKPVNFSKEYFDRIKSFDTNEFKYSEIFNKDKFDEIIWIILKT